MLRRKVGGGRDKAERKMMQGLASRLRILDRNLRVLGNH